MAEFIASRKTAEDFNNGVKYINEDIANNVQGDSVSADTINNLVESALYTQAVAESAKGLAPLVGLHYIQYPNEPTPAQIWGGTTWEIDTTLQGKTLVGSGGSYTLGTTNGSATHNHSASTLYGKLGFSTGSNLVHFTVLPTTQWEVQYDRVINMSVSTVQGTFGEGIAIGGNTDNASNMPPYMVVNYWKRTA